jgi:hypothetical protein
MEGIFKFLSILAILIFCFIVIGIFLLALKIALMFYPDLNILGLIIY